MNKLLRKKLKLGTVFKNDNIINHRSLLKVILNPILRLFGFQIASLVKDNKILKIIFCKCPKINRIKYPEYIISENIWIKKERWLY